MLFNATNDVKKQKKLSKSSDKTLHLALKLHHKINNIIETLALFIEYSTKNKPLAQWLEIENNEISINASFINIGAKLKEIIFDKAHATILTSATLRSLGNFDRFLSQVGLTPYDTNLVCVNSPFSYKKALITINPQLPLPDHTNEKNHTSALCQQFLTDFEKHNAGIMLFTSRKQLELFISLLPESLLKIAKIQYTQSRLALISQHKKAIDNNQRSLLIGTQSLSEGLDLPKQYLTFVGIAKIPFSNFSSPLELAEANHYRHLNKHPFNEITLPDASNKLIQNTGRLMRTMDCYGQIAIYDPRLTSRQYGKTLLENLPQYQIQIQ